MRAWAWEGTRARDCTPADIAPGCCRGRPPAGLATVVRCLALVRRDFFAITLALMQIGHRFSCWKCTRDPEAAEVGGDQPRSAVYVWQSYDAVSAA